MAETLWLCYDLWLVQQNGKPVSVPQPEHTANQASSRPMHKDEGRKPAGFWGQEGLE